MYQFHIELQTIGTVNLTLAKIKNCMHSQNNLTKRDTCFELRILY